MTLNTAQKDRAIGAMIGMAVGDALGAGYEYQATVPASDVYMRGGGLAAFAKGEWTDDTSMAIPILQALSQGLDLLASETQDVIVRSWIEWHLEAKDVGVHTRHILSSASATATAEDVAKLAADLYARGSRSAGNGSLMRTTPVVLGYLDDPEGLTTASMRYSLLTHGDPEAGEACVLWNQAQRHAILHGELSMSVGLEHLPTGRRGVWEQRLADAGAGTPRDFVGKNGWVVAALQEAYSAISAAPHNSAEDLEHALRAIVSAGGDTDTVAAIAGGLLGARWGISGVPLEWRRHLHGWPGRSGGGLVRMAALAANGGHPDAQGWPTVQFMYEQSASSPVVQHPHDAGVWIGAASGLDQLPPETGAVVSLCRLGAKQWPAAGIDQVNHVEVWLIDSAEDHANPNLEFVLEQAVGTIEQLRGEGRIVYLHCVEAHSRTPLVAALYGARKAQVPALDALESIERVLPQAAPNARFMAALADWGG